MEPSFSSIKKLVDGLLLICSLISFESCKEFISDNLGYFDFEATESFSPDLANDNFDGLSYYPINPYTTPDLWKELDSYEEMKKAVEVDSVSLSRLDTKQLMLVCLEYPLLLSYPSHADNASGLESICDSFIGFRILKSRDDYRSILSTVLSNFESSILAMSESGNRRYPNMLFEALNILCYGRQELTMSSILYSSCNLHSVNTPYGQSVYHFHITEADAQWISESNDYFITNFPNAIYVSSSTRSYNCHSYAWNMSNGGITAWINRFNPTSSATSQDNLSKYWTNDRYISVSASSSAMSIIYYPMSDHSAKKYSNSMYISKWGQGPLMKHAPGYGPYENMNYRQYYGIRQYQLSGEEFIYDNNPSDTHVYSIQGIPSWMNHTVSWVVLNGRGEEEDCIVTPSGDSCIINFLRDSMFEVYCIIYYPNGFQEAELYKEIYVENV